MLLHQSPISSVLQWALKRHALSTLTPYSNYYMSFHVIQALPLVTVVVGSQTSGKSVSMLTLSEAVEESQRVDFDLPTSTSPLLPGKPCWANYVKGVIQHYRGK